MAAGEIHLNDLGTTFILTIKDGDTVVDISSATTKTVIFKRPDGTTESKDGSFTTDGTDGKIEYSAEADFINQIGTWHLQAYIEISGNHWYSDISSFKVFANL